MKMKKHRPASIKRSTLHVLFLLFLKTAVDVSVADAECNDMYMPVRRFYSEHKTSNFRDSDEKDQDSESDINNAFNGKFQVKGLSDSGAI